MYSQSDIKIDIQKWIDWLESNNGEVLHPDFIVNKVLSDWKENYGDIPDPALCASKLLVRDYTRRELNKFKLSEDSDAQITLPGFRKLQRRYMIDRNGEQVCVKIENMTIDECEAKIKEMQSMLSGLEKHIEEMIGWIENKFGKQII